MGTEGQRRLTAIVFTDIVGYSAVVHRDEVLGRQLLDLQREVVRRIVPLHGGREVETAGDSFLLEFSSALAAVQAVTLIQQELARLNSDRPAGSKVVLRASVHLGDVEHRGDEVYGDGVNIAARLLAHSPEGGVALSAPVLALVRQRMQLPVRSIGAPTLKNISNPVELFVVDPEALRALAAPEAMPPDVTLRRRRVPRQVTWGAATGVGLLALGALLWRHGEWPRSAVDTREKSVAVLPFANLSGQKDSEYFADGVQDAIITDLAHVKDLKVISRTSVMEYKVKARNLREIGLQLGVANIVEGSVQKSGNRVRVTAQLIKVTSDQHLWAESYDRDIADVFAIQTDVARQIVAAVSATLTTEEKARIEQRPTTNPDAYDLYLRAKVIFWGDPTAAAVTDRVQQLLTRAVELDPDFALAHALLGLAHITLYWYAVDSSIQRRESARTEAETALRLQPGLAEGHVALGVYWYQGFMNFEKALGEFDAAMQVQPNLAEGHAFKGYVYRRQGRVEESLSELRRALELDPRNLVNEVATAELLELARRYAQADAAYAHVIANNPDNGVTRVYRAFCQARWKGNAAALHQALDGIEGTTDPDFAISRARVRLAEFEGRYADAVKLLESIPAESLTEEGAGRVPKDLRIAREYVFTGKPDRARSHFEAARTWLHDHPGTSLAWSLHAKLGLIDAYLGERNRALRELQEAQQANPNPRDPMLRFDYQFVLAEAYLQLGETGRALDELENALAPPAMPNGNDLRLDPAFASLHSNPRFQKLVAANLPVP